MQSLIIGNDGKKRCGWCAGTDIYEKYHDMEWGRLSLEDRKQFEFLVLESAQAGLSWLLILRKREGYRRAYKDFDPQKVALFGDKEINRMIIDDGIIRNRRKIEASISNARIFLEIRDKHGSFGNWLLRFFDNGPIMNQWESLEDIPASTPLSERISKEMKTMGFKFFGPDCCVFASTGYRPNRRSSHWLLAEGKSWCMMYITFRTHH